MAGPTMPILLANRRNRPDEGPGGVTDQACAASARPFLAAHEQAISFNRPRCYWQHISCP
jgi:hypothetical protein